jgi:hypothetical protein
MYFTLDTKGNPTAGIANIYEHVKLLNELVTMQLSYMRKMIINVLVMKMLMVSMNG